MGLKPVRARTVVPGGWSESPPCGRCHREPGCWIGRRPRRANAARLRCPRSHVLKLGGTRVVDFASGLRRKVIEQVWDPILPAGSDLAMFQVGEADRIDQNVGVLRGLDGVEQVVAGGVLLAVGEQQQYLTPTTDAEASFSSME